MKWIDDKTRLIKELEKAIKDAGGSSRNYNITETVDLLFAMQMNSIQISRALPDGRYQIWYERQKYKGVSDEGQTNNSD